MFVIDSGGPIVFGGSKINIKFPIVKKQVKVDLLQNTFRGNQSYC